ncbi:MAG: CDP-6-deoxy-delta-3,4-glucoseen reductase [Proteobacteria bacterium]|nr:MAG: CDP-6-deoxy-delta-3,4-glucoseen reductase [Pseudomonadota bacterium]
MPHQITVQPSGHQFEVDDHESVLAGALRQGIMLPYSCRGGSCGTCFGKVLEGEIDYPRGFPLGLMESDHEKGYALFCVAQARSDLLIDIQEVRSRDEIRIKTLPAEVVSVNPLIPDVMEVRLKLPASEKLVFRAGQHLDFLLRNKKRRSFAIANAPTNHEYLELHIRRVPSDEFSDLVFKQFHEGTLVHIEAPLGDFYVREESNRPLILMASGGGFAPMKSIVEQLRAEGDTRPVHLYWGAQTRRDLYHHKLARHWAMGERFEYTPVLSAEDGWQGRAGDVHQAIAEDFADLSGFDVYMAGPPTMIEAVTRQFQAQGLPPEQLYVATFTTSA